MKRACFLIILSCLSVSTVMAQGPVKSEPVDRAPAATSKPAAGNRYDLKMGVSKEREIAASDTHYYHIKLEPGQFFRGIVDQRGIDLVVTVYDPNGQVILEVDSPNGAKGPERIAWAVKTSGFFRIEVRPLESTVPSGRYEAKIEEILTAEEYAAVLAAAQAELDAVIQVAEPAYAKDSDLNPRVLFDEAHFNSHTSTGLFREFVELIRNDGYSVAVNTDKFDSQIISGSDVLIVATPQAFEDSLVNWKAPEITKSNWNSPAFTKPEIDAVRNWVHSGGALLLITGHAPRAFWSIALANQFGVDVHDSFVFDTLNSHRTYDTRPPGCWIIFSRENGLLGEHPITNGRSESEQVWRITVNGSASVAGPPGSTAFLRLAGSAREWVYQDFAFWPDARSMDLSAAGRAQGVAFRYGAGRVVVLTPSALFGYSYMKRPEMGDTRQLGLNIMHWLSGLMDQ